MLLKNAGLWGSTRASAAEGFRGVPKHCLRQDLRVPRASRRLEPAGQNLSRIGRWEIGLGRNEGFCYHLAAAQCALHLELKP